jgi:hypothetical protein
MRTPSLPTQRSVVAQANDRFEQITVKVFAVDENAPFEPAAEQLASLSRVYDPFAARNPDAIERLDPDALIQRIQDMFGSELPAGAGAPGTPAGGGNGGAGGGDSGGKR